jgi:hypothetical protein
VVLDYYILSSKTDLNKSILGWIEGRLGLFRLSMPEAPAVFTVRFTGLSITGLFSF